MGAMRPLCTGPPSLLLVGMLFWPGEPPPLAPADRARDTPATQGFELPPGSAADAVASVLPTTEPAHLPGEPWPAWDRRDETGWGSPVPWLRWARLVRAEAEAEVSDPVRRAQLALCARVQGRDRDAWDHLVSLAGQPEVIAALLPAFLPGAQPGNGPAGAPPQGSAGCVEVGGLPGDLRSGDRLRPPLPPALDPERIPPGTIPKAVIGLERFRVGDSELAFRLELLEDGVEIKLRHLAGPAAELFFVLPTPRGQSIRSIYANWERVPDPDLPVGLRVSAEEPEGELWGRFFPRSARWPEALPRGRDARVQEGEMRLVGPVDDPFLASMAQGLGALLETECGLVEGPLPAAGFREPLSIHLEEGPDREPKLLGLISRAEAYVLRRSPMVSPPRDG